MAKQNLGLRNNARNPASIQNDQNHDASASQRSANGVPGTIKKVVAASNVLTNLEDFALLWCVNRDTVPHYIQIGDDGDLGSATDATNGMAIPAGEGMLIMCGASSDDLKSLACKTDSTQVHLTILKA